MEKRMRQDLLQFCRKRDLRAEGTLELGMVLDSLLRQMQFGFLQEKHTV